MKKQIVVAAITLMLAGTGAFTATQAFAEDTNASASETIVQKLVEKFGLNREQVQAVFDEVHTQRMQEHETEGNIYLAKLVSDGKITEAQKQLILEKRKDMLANRPNRETMQNLTPDERKAQMEAKKQEMDTWASQNGIDPQYVMGNMGKGGHGRGHMSEASPAK